MFDICIDIDLDELSNELSKKFINSVKIRNLYRIKNYEESNLIEIERCYSWSNIQYKIDCGIVSIKLETQNSWI